CGRVGRQGCGQKLCGPFTASRSKYGENSCTVYSESPLALNKHGRTMQTLPREMQQHTYAIMDGVEDTHWWFVGRRAILESFLRPICDTLKKQGRKEVRILDVGCGTGANIEMHSQFGDAEGVDVSDDALEF